MIFSSPVFLFLFLPLSLFLIFFTPDKVKNLVLLILSLFFYTWGEGQYILLLLLSIITNFSLGLFIGKTEHLTRKGFLIGGVVFNLSILFFFKYSGFLIGNLAIALPILKDHVSYFKQIHLPLGISFFTFQALSYIIDVYHKETAPQKNLINYALLIALFPHQIAGPIIRYRDIASQLTQRTVNREKLMYGIERFILGLSKKMLLANTLAYAADEIFLVPADQLSTLLCWFGIVCYSLQLYYDFSGYSDMAIGLGAMFGFHFLENFNFPYISKSVQEFWRRWHISLSTWFRDYVYIPLGGNRVGKTRAYINLLIVFFLTGFWHGASWTFIFWGLFHGFFITIEKLFLGKVLNRVGAFWSHLYTIIVVLVGWVLFRAHNFTFGRTYIKTMFSFTTNAAAKSHLKFLTSHELLLVMAVGIVFATPLMTYFKRVIAGITDNHNGLKVFSKFSYSAILFSCFLLSILYLTANTYNPFIYFRF